MGLRNGNGDQELGIWDLDLGMRDGKIGIWGCGTGIWDYNWELGIEILNLGLGM